MKSRSPSSARAINVVIRADASRSIGVGHVMRCWALAEELSARGVSVTWQGSFDVPWLRSALRASGWPVLNPRDPGRFFGSSPHADWVVIDSYDLDGDYRLALLDRGIKILAIVDDSHADVGPASLWVNPGAPMGPPYRRDDAFLEGPDYVLIRREVRELRHARSSHVKRRGAEMRITILLGGTDAAGLGVMLSHLHEVPVDLPPLIAGPGSFPSNQALTWISGGERLLKMAAVSQLLVTPAGLSSWEGAHIGVPMAITQAAGNQAGNYRFMTSSGRAWPLGPATHLRDPHTFLDRVAGAWDAASDGSLSGVSTIDGLGASRVVDRLLEADRG